MLPFTSLGAATSVGPGSSRDLEDVLRTHTMFVTVTGSPSGVLVRLQLSHDGLNWHSIDSVSGGDGVVTSADHLARYVRADVATLSGGSSPTVTTTIASQ